MHDGRRDMKQRYDVAKQSGQYEVLRPRTLHDKLDNLSGQISASQVPGARFVQPFAMEPGAQHAYISAEQEVEEWWHTVRQELAVQ